MSKKHTFVTITKSSRQHSTKGDAMKKLKPERRHDMPRDVPQNFIDEVMPEAHQASFALGLKEALRVIAEHLPEGAIDEIQLSLMVVRGNFEGLSESSHREIARRLKRENLVNRLPEQDHAAGLAVGMIDYWLFDLWAENQRSEACQEEEKEVSTVAVESSLLSICLTATPLRGVM